MSFESTLLKPDSSRYVMFPLKDKDTWTLYKKQIDSFWRVEEVDTSSDKKSFDLLNTNEQRFIKMILAFFAASDGFVIENLAARFLNEVQLAEVRAFYSFQIAMENIHSEMYSLLIDTYIDNPDEKNSLFSALDKFDCIKKKGQWARKWILDESSSFALRLVGFACIEGIFFSGAFCSIYWLKKRGLMPGLTFSNELIARDEALHTEFAVTLFSKLDSKPDSKKVEEIIREAVEIETEFICEALPCRLIGMNSKSMTQYIQFVADRLAIQLGLSAIFDVSNPFDFMELISVEGKTNFFEKRVGEYALADMTQSADTFSFAGDF